MVTLARLVMLAKVSMLAMWTRLATLLYDKIKYGTEL